MIERKNELDPRMIGTGALNLLPDTNSSPRKQMFMSHVGQALVIEGATPRRIQTGMEREYGKYTFSIKMPCDGRIITVFEKYPRSPTVDDIKENPKSLVIYENEYTKEVGIIEIPRHHCEHQYFGFNYKLTEAGKNLYAGAFIAKDTILADSPSIDENNNWCYGIEAEVAMMSIPSIIEDGVSVRRGFLEKMKTKGFESRVGKFGKKYYPLNIYGDLKNYKPFPDIGDKIRPDGLLMAFRRYDDLLGAVEMSPEALLKPDYMYDKLIYTKPNGKVIDINVFHVDNGGFTPTPTGMVEQVNKYNNAARVYYNRIIAEHAKLRNKTNITPEFHRLVTEALAFTNNPGDTNRSQGKINYTYRRDDVDDYRVEITFEYDVIPNIGYKLTGCQGDRYFV